MSAEGGTVEFEPYPMRRRVFASVEANQYCVWTLKGESREIKADTAYEAFRKSGFDPIIKIERLSNLGKNVLERSIFTDAADTAKAELKLSSASDAVQEKIRLRRNPVLHPDEMDELMRFFRRQATEDTMAIEPIPEPDSDMQAVVNSTVEHTPLPPPSPWPVETETLNPMGLDVHGDGFDEIIPAAHHAKPSVPHPPREAKSPPSSHADSDRNSATLPPERELSADEVEKLIGGK